MRIKDQRFEDDEVLLDGNSFKHCVFSRCRMKFTGQGGPVEMDECEFHDCKWIFGGPAASTVEFIKTLADASGDYGRSMIVNTFPILKEWLTEEAKSKLLPGTTRDE